MQNRETQKENKKSTMATRAQTSQATPLQRTRPQGLAVALLNLQRTRGNRFVQRMLSRSAAEPGQAKESAPEIEKEIEIARGGGRELEPGVRAKMESAFGHGFGGVRVHTDDRADELNRALGARAFTTGRDIFFSRSEYNPDSRSGRELLAHELTHVVQQEGAAVQAKLEVSQPGDRSEQEADEVAARVVDTLENRAPEQAGGGTPDALASGQQGAREARPDAPRPRAAVKSFSYSPPVKGAKPEPPSLTVQRPDTRSGGGEAATLDQSSSVTTFTATANGVNIVVEVVGGYSSAEFPDGFKWTQTIDTNVPLGGTTSPYVDPRPNDDTKPFYWTDAEHAANPTTFRDRPSRPAPATGTTNWDAILGLNGVNEATRTVTGFDYLTYGFSIDSTGTVTTRNPSVGNGANHRAILTSEFGGWTFN